MLLNYNTNILIIGAGPAGASTSLFLCKNNIKHIIVDKESFPRDKICGDALSGKVISLLRKLDESILSKIYCDDKYFTGSYGVKFVSPNSKSIDIPFKINLENHKHPAGFISKRIHFDYFLFKHINNSIATILEKHQLTKLEKNDDGFVATLIADKKTVTINTKLIISAEGDRSLIRKQFTSYKLNPKHYCAGLRAYYTGVSNMHPQNFIELHFLPELKPGYFWIFPLPNGEANVGVGMISALISKNKINLREAMLSAIKNNPTINSRFKNATLIGDIKGWGLPLGSRKVQLSGDRFLLTGDSASLIDPFTGEGIANAMISGMIAAEQAQKCVEHKKYDAKFLMNYDIKIYNELWDELNLSYKIQRLSSYSWLFNLIINKSERNKTLRDTLTVMFDDLSLREKFKKPSFYLKLLFNK